MKTTKQIIGEVISGIGFFLFGLGIIYRFCHPELTSTQLLIALWPLYLPAFIAVVVGAKLRWT